MTKKYFVTGMHCASCELLIEKKLIKLPGVRTVEANKGESEVKIEYKKERPSLDRLNQLFAKDGYEFFDKKVEEKEEYDWKKLLIAAVIAIGIMGGFLALNKLGLNQGGVNINSSLVSFVVFGLLAGISSCAALVGGIVLSMSKKWGGDIRPQIEFNAGRIVAYIIVGIILGSLGGMIGLSPTLSTILTFGVAGVMMILGLQMVGLKQLAKIKISLPKSVSGTALSGSGGPMIVGMLTVLLPCGFTITTEGLAVASGDPIRGGLMMGAFAMGTLPILLVIGLSSGKLLEKSHWSDLFLKTAGILVIALAIYNVNNQMNVLGTYPPTLRRSDVLKDVTTELQTIRMEVNSRGYEPNYFQVKAGGKIRWEITDTGTSGCTNAIIARQLFAGEIRLTPGETSIKEFTIEKPGSYRFSCWMGMATGIIEAI